MKNTIDYSPIISGFSDEISSDFTQQLAIIKELNLAYIEIRGVSGKNITAHTLNEVESLHNQLKAAGVKISAIGSPIGKINITDDFGDHFQLFKHTVDIANLLETNYIRLFSFHVPFGEKGTYRTEVMSRLSAMIDYINGSDIILLHENEKDIYGDTATSCLDLIETLRCPNFRLIFDPQIISSVIRSPTLMPLIC